MLPLSVPTLVSRGSLKVSGLLAFSLGARVFTTHYFKTL
jgi:hypothetical protein